MPIKSETSRLIDQIIATGPALLLKRCGYRKLARSFHLESGAFFKVVHFQASMWNTPDSAQFTINLNIVLPYYHEKRTGKPFPKNPGSAAPVLSQRIGELMPAKQDFWWQITPKTDLNDLAVQVTKVLSEAGLAFLDQHADVQILAKVAQQKDEVRRLLMNPDLSLAILLSFEGKDSEAARVVQELAKKNTHQEFAKTIQLIAQRLQLNVPSKQ